jgi:hypothetical protein
MGVAFAKRQKSAQFRASQPASKTANLAVTRKALVEWARHCL